MDFIPITPANFEEHKKRIIKLVNNIQIDDLDPQYEMSMSSGIKMGNHANTCDTCNVLHYLMAIIIDTHRLQVEK